MATTETVIELTKQIQAKAGNAARVRVSAEIAALLEMVNEFEYSDQDDDALVGRLGELEVWVDYMLPRNVVRFERVVEEVEFEIGD